MNEVGIDRDDGSVSLVKNGGEVKKVFVTEVLENQHQMGGVYEKRKVEAVVDPKDKERSERKMRLVLKDAYLPKRYDFSFDNPEMSMAERYFRKWKLLKENGIPTTSSMRVVDEEVVAMGDMTWDGSEFFGKEKDITALEGRDSAKRKLFKMEKVFLSIDPEKIKEEMERVLKLAWDKGIRLPYDDQCDLLVHPDGTWEVLVMDLSQLRPRKEESEEALEDDRKDMWQMVDEIRSHLLEIAID